MQLRRLACGTALLVAGTLARPVRAGDATGAFAPYEDIVPVIADLTWHLKDDVYRFPPPQDPTGHDLYGLTLARLDAWEKRFPNRLRDVISFTRAETLERLGEYRRAADGYAKVAALPSPLAPRANDCRARAEAFAVAAALPETGSDIGERLTLVRRKLDAWDQLLTRYQATAFQPVVMVEIERLERIGATIVADHRDAIENGDATAERSLRFLIEKHADSKNLPSHILRLGDLYADLAREYVATHDRPLAFDPDEFTRRADRALDTYRKVATWDGAREKPEGQGHFAAFEAWKSITLARYR
ncbi:MAG: hypothetical protein U0807_18545 [Candidatus Binatia bacterium]